MSSPARSTIRPAMKARTCSPCQSAGPTCILPEHKPVRREREMIDLLAVEEPKPKPANLYDTAVRAFSYEAAIDQLFKRMRSASSAPNPTSGQYSQGPGTQRKTSPATATWQTDGNER